MARKKRAQKVRMLLHGRAERSFGIFLGSTLFDSCLIMYSEMWVIATSESPAWFLSGLIVVTLDLSEPKDYAFLNMIVSSYLISVKVSSWQYLFIPILASTSSFFHLKFWGHNMWDVVLCKRTNGIEKKLSGIRMLQPLHFVCYYFDLVWSWLLANIFILALNCISCWPKSVVSLLSNKEKVTSVVASKHQSPSCPSTLGGYPLRISYPFTILQRSAKEELLPLSCRQKGIN